MKHLFSALSALLLLVTTSPLKAELKLFACEPEWAALAKELGGNKVEIYTATTARQDPHHIQARPSLIAKVRRTDLIVCSGAELEVGWLPMLLRQANNPAVLPGKTGHFEASSFVERLEVSKSVDRTMGDVHASGNPHIHLDPHRLEQIAEQLAERLIMLDTGNSDYYRQHYHDFSQRWQQAIVRWEKTTAPLKGVHAVVHHKDWVYLFDWLGMIEAGALEPKPGLPTSPGHLAGLKRRLENEPAKMILHTAYQNDRAAHKLSRMSGLPIVALPYTVGGNEQVTDLFTLFDDTIERLLEAAK
jgi:zinc/manganese transport system substrate-binding protein